METLATKTKKDLASLSKFVLDYIAEHKCPPVDENCVDAKYISLSDAFVIADLSTRYLRVAFSKMHNIRVTSSSKAVTADQQLQALILQIPELNDFVQGTINPGDYFASLKLLSGGQAAAILKENQDEMFLSFDNGYDVPGIIRIVGAYNFYKDKREKFPSEFEVAESKMKELVKSYAVPLRLSYNAFVDPETKPKRAKVDKSFLHNYGAVA